MISLKLRCFMQNFYTMKTFKSLAIAVSGLCVLPTAVQAKNIATNEVGMAMMRLNASAVSDEVKYAQTASSNKKSYGGSVWNHLRNDFRMAEVNSNLVRSHEYKFATNSAYFNRTLNRSKPYMYHIVQEVKKRGMPAEIALLPFIESAYVIKASSHVGASGLWQFMPATGRHYGLEQTPLYDGRHDVYAATDAALNYLQYLHGLFGDWSLALAAYNWGEGNVTRAVRRAQASGIAPTYENLKMPAETRNYVPKLLAVRNLVRNPQAYGLSLPEIENTPYFKAVTVNNPVDIMAAAHLANISESEFLALNPAFKTPVFIPKNGRKMLLPVAAAKTFETNYKENNTKSLLSWDVFTPSYNMPISEVAAKTGTDVNELRRLNGLNGNQISAGRSVLVAKNGKATQALSVNFQSADKDNTPDTFVEKKQPVITNFVAKTEVESAHHDKSAILAARIMASNNLVIDTADNIASAPVSVATAPAVPKLATSRDFVAQQKMPTTDFTALTKAAANNLVVNDANPVVENTTTPVVTPASDMIAQNNQAIISAEELAKIDNEIQQNAANNINFVAANPTNKAVLLPEEMDLVSQQKTVVATAAPKNVATTDPLLALANEKANALREARAVAARAKREAERAKAAARIAEAKEVKRKAQEQARAEKLKQANELAALRRAREAGEPITTAIREQQVAAAATTHRVKEGDTLFNIAQRYNLNVVDLVNANNLRGNSIRVGQVLKVTGSKSVNPPRNPMTKVSGRTSAVMGLSREVTVSSVPFDSRNQKNTRKPTTSKTKINTKLMPS